MADKKKGYIPLWRDIQNNFIWLSEEPFDDRSAWVDLLLTVNHEPREIKVNKDVIRIEAGQTWTSYVKLAKKWHWSRNRVYRYIKMLEKAKMITICATPNGTLLTLVNYSNFALVRNTSGTTDGTAHGTTHGTSDGTTGGTQTIKKDNIKMKENEKEAPSAPPVDGGEWQ